MATAPARVRKQVKRTRGTRNVRRHSVTQVREPKNEQDKLFCERWLVHHDHQKAYIEAGWSEKGGDKHTRALNKLKTFRRYLERMQPKVELVVAKKIAYERADILEAIARVGYANALDYIEEYTFINAETQIAEQRWQLKPIQNLTRDQAAALDSIQSNLDGTITYTLPKAKTRLSALTTLGEQAANFKKAGTTHNHLHLGEHVPLDKIRQLKQMFIEAMGPQATRELLGMNEEEQAQ